MQQRPKDFSDPSQYLWTDTPNARDELARRAPELHEPAVAFEHWIREGYSIMPGGVPQDDIARFQADVDERVNSGSESTPISYWDSDGHHYGNANSENIHKLEAKVLDLHVRLASAIKVALSTRVVNFLADVFKDDVVAFQSLYFHNGSQQGAHQDTAFVYTSPAMHFAAAWIALEDVKPGSGELFYYPKSHQLDDFIFASGTKALLPGDPVSLQYSSRLDETCAQVGLSRKTFLPRRGDVLFWAPDLIHGGKQRVLQRSRRSFVIHYCPKSATVPYAAESGKEVRQVSDKGWVVAKQ